MTDSPMTDNPMGLDGFAFVEFTVFVLVEPDTPRYAPRPDKTEIVNR